MAQKLELKPNQRAYLVPGDGRTDANTAGQGAQMAGESELKEGFAAQGIELVRLHPEVDPRYGHGFIQDIAQARDVYSQLPKDSPVIAFLTQWAFNDRMAPLLWTHDGPILVASNFSGADPGLVGAAGLNACLSMHDYEANGQVGQSFLWSSHQFKDPEAKGWIKEWVDTGRIDHSALLGYKQDFYPADFKEYQAALDLGARLATDFLTSPRIAGVLDIGCMGMLNAAWDERDMLGTGVNIGRLSQSELLYRMKQIPETEAEGYIDWIVERGFNLDIGTDPKTEITRPMKIESGQMYGAYVKWIYDLLGFDGATISFQTGMNDSCASSDLPETLGNGVVRPPVIGRDGKEIRKGRNATFSNEADLPMLLSKMYHEAIYEAAMNDSTGIGQLIIARAGPKAYQALSNPMMWTTTGHDVRWGDMMECKDGSATYLGHAITNLNAFVWAFNLSGNMPFDHTEAAWSNPAKPCSDGTGRRHAFKYFGEGGITNEALARSGAGIWSREYMLGNEKHMDIGLYSAVTGSPEETERMWSSVSRTWPLLEAVLPGVSRDAFMAGHKSNHISVSYAPNAESAKILLLATANMGHNLGYKVHLCGSMDVKDMVEYKVGNGLAVEGPTLRTS